jgi:twitching motility protein PilJ
VQKLSPTKITAPPRPIKQKPRGSADATVHAGFFGNLKVGQKLALIAVAFAVPLAVLVFLLVNEQGKSIDFATKEVVGAQYLVQINSAIDSIKRHRRQARTTISKPTSENQQKLTDEAAKVDASLSALMGDTVHAGQFGVMDSLVGIKTNWDVLKGDVLKLNQIQNLNRHSSIIVDQIYPLLVQVSNRSGLALDPDLDTYYSVNLVVNDLPNASESLAKLASYTFAALNAKTFTSDDKVRVELLGQQLQSALRGSQQSLSYVLEANSSLKDTLGTLGDTASTLTKTALDLSRTQVVEAPAPTFLPITWNKEQGKAGDAILALRDTTTTQLIQLLQNRIGRLQANRRVSLGAVVAALALALGLLLWITQLITRPIGALIGVIENVGRGDLSQSVQVKSKDEIGVLAGAFNDSIQNLRETARRNQEELERNESLQSNIGEFLNVTMDISQGDFTKKGHVTDDVLGNVVDAINVMTEEIGLLLKDVSSAADQVLKGSNQMTAVNDHIAQSTEGQARLAEQARARAVEVTASIRAMAQGAAQTAQAAQQTLQASQQGQVAVTETMTGMESVRREMQGLTEGVQSLALRSNEIQTVVKTIANFASQTNLLALSAALEAAGAGESGKRFASVADQVRKLADDSTRATQQITALIKSFEGDISVLSERAEGGAREVEQGYKVAAQAGARLQDISRLAQQSAALVQGISSVTQQQAINVEQVSRAAQVIASTAAQTGTESAKGRQAAQELRLLSQELTQNLSRFRLPGA